MDPTEEQKDFSELYKSLDGIIREREESHNTIICDKLHALEVITTTISNLVTIAKNNHHGHEIFVYRVLDIVSSMQEDAGSLVLEIRRDVQEELS